MRINLNPNNLAATDAAASQSKATTRTTDSAANDKAELSPDQARVQSLTAQLNQLPDVRNNKINELWKAIKQGTYQVTAEQTADAIIADVQGRLAA